MIAYCNRCRKGAPAFGGTAYIDGKVYHRWTCECGNTEDRLVDPFGYDLDDPRAVRSMLLTPDYGRRIGLYDRGERAKMNRWEPVA